RYSRGEAALVHDRLCSGPDRGGSSVGRGSVGPERERSGIATQFPADDGRCCADHGKEGRGDSLPETGGGRNRTRASFRSRGGACRSRAAVLATYDGRDQEAVALFVANLAKFPGARTDLDLPIGRRLATRPDFQAAVQALDSTLADQRRSVLKMLCVRERVPQSWQPAPETCTHLTMVP